jgi:hypothetical protein
MSLRRPRSNRDRAGRRGRWKWLSHPLLLLLVGGAFTACITNYLIPRITHEWQTHDKELEMENDRYQKEVAVKALLARDIGKSTGSFLAVMHSIELSWSGKTGPAYDRAYEEWSASSSGISSQIGVYFPDAAINDSWREYTDNVYTLYSLHKHKDLLTRKTLLAEIAQYIDDTGLGKSELDVIAVFNAPHDDVDARLDAYLKRLLGGFKSRADQVITAILGASSILTEDPADEPRPRRLPATGLAATLSPAGRQVR